MPKKTGFELKHKPMFNKPSKFEERWGEPAYKIAEREDVSVTNIYMRVHNYGNPYQRRAKPTAIEAKYGKTRQEIAKELHLHPITVGHRELYDTGVYIEDKKAVTHNRNTKYTGIHWTEQRAHNYDKFWLMPEHPDYAKERAKADKFNVAEQIAIADQKLLAQEAKNANN